MSYKKKTALIFGISGQDGLYLTKLLQKKNFKVIGTSRKKKNIEKNLRLINADKNVKVYKVNPQIFKEVKFVIKKSKCDQIYYFSGISSVFYSFSHEEKTINTNISGFVNILEACRIINPRIRIYNAASSECFGSSNKTINENTNFLPQSPYALSKVINVKLAQNYRENLGMHIVNGFSFNHDSAFRPNAYILKKISNYLRKKPKKKLKVGNIDITRDWGWAPEHIEFIYKIMQSRKPDDYIIATGKSIKLKDIIFYFFKKFKIDKKNLEINNKFLRKNDIIKSKGNPLKIKKKFRNLPQTDAYGLMENLINNKYF